MMPRNLVCFTYHTKWLRNQSACIMVKIFHIIREELILGFESKKFINIFKNPDAVTG